MYNPEIAIRLAVRNVADLFKLFPNNPYAVAASYNTYDTNVERWIFRARSSDIDRFVAEIALPETKDYVAKVMGNYRAYRQLYTEDLSREAMISSLPKLIAKSVQNSSIRLGSPHRPTF